MATRGKAFVSQACADSGIPPGYGLDERVEDVRSCRGIGKRNTKNNDACPAIAVDCATPTVDCIQETAKCFSPPAVCFLPCFRRLN